MDSVDLLGGVQHEDAGVGRGDEVDVVDADARTGDRLQLARIGEDFRGHLDAAAADDRVVLRSGGDEVVLFEPELLVVGDATILEEFEALGGDFVGDQHAVAHRFS